MSRLELLVVCFSITIRLFVYSEGKFSFAAIINNISDTEILKFCGAFNIYVKFSYRLSYQAFVCF